MKPATLQEFLENYVQEHYSELRGYFEEFLVELGYSSVSASESDDGRDAWLLDYYKNW